MALEAINTIKDTESKAESIISEAKKEQKTIIQNATSEAEKEYSEIIEAAKNQKNQIIESLKASGDKEAEPILQQGIIEVENIKNISQEVKSRAVNIIVERIVKMNGNS